MGIKKFQLFSLGKKIDKADQVRLYLPANMAYRRCSYDFDSSPVVKITWNILK